MRKFSSLFSNLCLIALLALPAVFTSCSDDDEVINAPKIVSLGMSNDTIVDKGTSFTISPKLNTAAAVAYSWTVNGKEVSTENSYKFEATTAGAYEVVFKANNEAGIDQGVININVRTYFGGFYVVNEGWFGHDPGSVNYYNGKTWSYRVFKENNPGKTLGGTTTDAKMLNNRIYFVSKDSPILIESDLNTFKQESVLETTSVGKANNFCAVNEKWGVLTTSNGAYKVSLNPLGLGALLPGTTTVAHKDIIKAGNYLFIIAPAGILVYNAADATFVKTINKADTGFAQSKDGSLWAARGNTLIKINPSNLATEEITLSDKVEVNYNTTYTPSCLCASSTENAIYFVKKDGWNSKDGYKYDIATKTMTKIVSAPTGYSFYGAGLAVNPKNGYVYATFTEDGWGEHYKNNKILVANPQTATLVETIDYSGQYWFPSIIKF